MTYGAFSPGDFAAYDPAPRSDNSMSLPLLCGITLIASASVGLWMLYAPGPTTPDVAAIPSPAPIQVAVAQAETIAAPPAAIGPLRRYAGFLDPTYSGGSVPGTFAQSAPLRSGFSPAARHATDPLAAPVVELRTADAAADATGAFKTASLDPNSLDTTTAGTGEPQVVPPAPVVSEIQSDVPLPAPRPRFEEDGHQAMPAAPTAAARVARQAATETPAPAAPAQPGFFDKFFARPQSAGAPTPAPQPTGTAMAYAAPQESLIGNLFAGRPASSAAVPERDTAVYDISAHTVYMPDGTQLEAHSGLGDALDNPNGVHLRMRGATPPNVYSLTLRESLFHGVRAIRLTPIGNGETYGRAGLLAHTYMLRGRSGESNGCVVFRNYEAFLRAFDNGQVRRMVVVARRA